MIISEAAKRRLSYECVQLHYCTTYQRYGQEGLYTKLFEKSVDRIEMNLLHRQTRREHVYE